MNWRPFQVGNRVFTLQHLDAFAHNYEVAGTAKEAAKVFSVDVTFSSHCFTKGLPKAEAYDPSLVYKDAREIRLFDERRYALSHRLPEIVRGMLRRKCRHTGHGNFFTIEVIAKAGHTEDDDIFFQASRSSTRGRINLFVQSAFIRESGKLPATRTIRFEIVLHNTLQGKPIRA